LLVFNNSLVIFTGWGHRFSLKLGPAILFAEAPSISWACRCKVRVGLSLDFFLRIHERLDATEILASDTADALRGHISRDAKHHVLANRNFGLRFWCTLIGMNFSILLQVFCPLDHNRMVFSMVLSCWGVSSLLAITRKLLSKLFRPILLQLLLQVKVILVSLLNSWHWRAWLVFWRENSWL